jgi:hypothetical protein
MLFCPFFQYSGVDWETGMDWHGKVLESNDENQNRPGIPLLKRPPGIRFVRGSVPVKPGTHSYLDEVSNSFLLLARRRVNGCIVISTAMC